MPVLQQESGRSQSTEPVSSAQSPSSASSTQPRGNSSDQACFPPIGIRISAVIPTMNEAANLPHVFARLPEGLHEVIVVDGHSTDDTVAVARMLRPDVRIVLQNRRGKGNALACGFAAARGEIIVMLDADGSTDPAEIPRFVSVLADGADFAKGSRFLADAGSADITRLRRAGNSALNMLVNLLYRSHYTDLCYGYNAFWARCLPCIGITCDGFEVETLINVRIARAGLRVVEVPSFEAERIHGESKLNTFRDGRRVLRTILRERVRRRATEQPRWRPEFRELDGDATLLSCALGSQG